MGCRNLPDQALYTLSQPGAGIHGQRPQRDVELRKLRDNIAGGARLDTTHRCHHRIKHIEAPGNKGLYGLDDFAGHRHWIYRIVRHRAMTAAALQPSEYRVDRSENRTGATCNHARGHLGLHVQCVNRLWWTIRIQQAFVEHGLGAAWAFLAWLEHKAHAAGYAVTVRMQKMRSTCKHCRVCVVAAGVHTSGFLRSKGQAGIFGHRQCIHVAPQQHRRTRLGTVQGRHDPAGGIRQRQLKIQALQ